MRSWDSVCPVCRKEGVDGTAIESAVPWRDGDEYEDRSHSDDAVLVHCPACGEFVVTDRDCVNLKSDRLRAEWNPAHLSALLREQTTKPFPPFWLRYGDDPYGALKRDDLAPIDVDELLARWPRTVPERLERALCNLARLSKRGGAEVKLDGEYKPLVFAETREEAQFHIHALIDRKDLMLGHESGGVVLDIVVTACGWGRFEELTRGASAPENPVFVAMSFGVKEKKSDDELTEAEMKEVYDSGIDPAVRKAGYRVIRADLVEHNQWIMDQVLGDIRLAPFVVADFTGHRNGVYFEAGFSRGLGTPVVHTCHQDHFKKAHFDTSQINHILWKTPEELRERLYNRIMANMGRGPHPSPTGSS